MSEEQLEGTALEQPAETGGEATPASTETLEQKPFSEHLKANFEKLAEKSGRERDEKGKFKNSTVQESAAPSPIEAPQHWSAADKEQFARADEATKRFLLDRHKAMEADYTRKTQEIATERQKIERLGQVFSLYAEELKQSGMDEIAAVQWLVESQKEQRQFLQELRQNPREVVNRLLQSQGLDPSTVFDAGEYADPQYAELANQNRMLQEHINRLTGTVEKIQNAPVEMQIHQFATAKDEQGNPRYPHFEKVRHLMAPLVSQGKTLEEAYSEVVWSLPEERTRLLELERKKYTSEEQKQHDESRQKAQAAARAAGAPFKPGTLDSRGSDNSGRPISEHLRENARKLGLA